MGQDFYSKLDDAYVTAAKLFSSFREEFKGVIKQGFTPVNIPPSIGSSRVILPLGDGLLIKFKPYYHEGVTYAQINCGVALEEDLLEEHNGKLLREFGINEQNGFKVIDNKVVGLRLEVSLVQMNPSNKGFTITEDLTEGSKYRVDDIVPTDFFELTNRRQFLNEYQRHLSALLSLYHDPRIVATVNRHGTNDKPLEAISRMLLKKVRNNIGEIVIGDLDNIVFEEASFK
jgi:hypothetical protein